MQNGLLVNKYWIEQWKNFENWPQFGRDMHWVRNVTFWALIPQLKRWALEFGDGGGAIDSLRTQCVLFTSCFHIIHWHRDWFIWLQNVKFTFCTTTLQSSNCAHKLAEYQTLFPRWTLNGIELHRNASIWFSMFQIFSMVTSLLDLPPAWPLAALNSVPAPPPLKLQHGLTSSCKRMPFVLHFLSYYWRFSRMRNLNGCAEVVTW